MRFGLMSAALLIAAPSNATTFLAEMRGVVVQQLDHSFDDPNVKVGDIYKLTARFDDSLIQPWWSVDGSELIAAKSVNFLSAYSRKDFWLEVNGSGFQWTAGHNRIDGVWLTFDKGRVSGFYADLLPAETDAQPGLAAQGVTGLVYGGDNVDLNNYVSPGFRIRWNVNGSKLMAVPEPSSWAMMIGGFGLVGASFRRQKYASKECVSAAPV